MASKSVEYTNVQLQEVVPDNTLRTEDAFDSDEDDWETESSGDDIEMDCDKGEEFESGMGNPGWADAMAKILKSSIPKGKEKSIVLAKAKTINDVKAVKDQESFEVVGEIKEEKPDPILLNQVAVNKTKNCKKEWTLMGRLKPCILEKNREKVLAKIASKGVVQLFNSVRNHQISLNKKLNRAGTVRKKDKVIQSVNKQTFLDMLMGSTHTKVKSESEITEKEMEVEPKDKTWDVLRDDFMMGGGLKDWDKAPELQPCVTSVKGCSVAEKEEEESYHSSDSSEEENVDTIDN